MNKNPTPTAMESPTIMKQRGSWSMLADLAADMVNNLDLGDHDCGDEPSFKGLSPPPTKKELVGLPSITPPGRKKEPVRLPAMCNPASSAPVPAKGGKRGSVALRNLWGGEDDYDPSADDLKSQAKQQTRASAGMFSSLTLPARQSQAARKDPLVEFHERRSKAVEDYRKKQEASKRRQQMREYDDDKSLASSNSFFDFLMGSGASDALMNDDKSREGRVDDPDGRGDGDPQPQCAESGAGGMKRTSSSHSMSTFFSLFGDDKEQVKKLSASAPQAPARKAEEIEDPNLRAAVQQSKSVKGDRMYAKGKRASERGHYKKAVAYLHIALVKQRDYYGEDHLVPSNTLNELGLALMHMGEHFGALTALEEALHIRQELLGPGAEEVAETTKNIWLVLKAAKDEEDGA